MLREIRVVIIEEFRFMRDMIGSVVRSIPDFNLIIQSSSIEDVLLRLDGVKPQVILLDADMPGVKDGLMIKRILQIAPDVGIICTSQQGDETVARLVVQSGAKGYLIKPFGAQELVEAIQSFDGPQLLPVSEIITLVSPKGNCGKTTLAINLALGLVRETGHRIGIMDANLQFGDSPVFLNIDPAATIVEASRDVVNLSAATMDAYLSSYGKNIKVLAPARRPELAELVGIESLLNILKRMRSLFRYVLVDTAPGFDEKTLALTNAADIVYLTVAVNSSFDVDHLKKSVDFLRSLGYQREKVKVVLSRIRMRGNMDSLNQLREELYYPITALLPNQFQLATNAINKGIPLLSEKQDSELAQGILGIAKDIVAYRNTTKVW